MQQPRGLIILIHGLGDHSGRYENLAQYLASLGWRVDGLDLPGHGATSGRVGQAPSWEYLVRLVERFIRRQRLGRLPLFLYGHSMGAALALQVALDQRVRINGLVASAPPLLIAQPIPLWKLRVAGLLEPVMPALRMATDIDPAHLSRDPGVVAAYENDPLVRRKVPLRLGLGLIAAGALLLERGGELRVPALLMHGEADQIADIAGSHNFCRRAGALCRWVAVPGGYHELHHEPDWRQTAALVAGWLDDQVRVAEGPNATSRE